MIHGAIYETRSDVQAVVHNHAYSAPPVRHHRADARAGRACGLGDRIRHTDLGYRHPVQRDRHAGAHDGAGPRSRRDAGPQYLCAHARTRRRDRRRVAQGGRDYRDLSEGQRGSPVAGDGDRDATGTLRRRGRTLTRDAVVAAGARSRVGIFLRPRRRGSDLAAELGFEIGVRERKAVEDLSGPIVFAERTKEAGPVEGRTLHDDVHGDQALVIGHLRLRRAELAERPLETAERDQPVAANGVQPAPRRPGIVTLEVLRQTFVQPGRDSPRRRIGNHRMGQLVGQHALE